VGTAARWGVDDREAKGEVQLLYSGADTFVRVDGDLDTAVDMVIRVAGVHITAGDLIL